ncbi:MAG: PAS-domain containing protein, partial [Microbacterium sp.]|nr:PAS-domain containing protein [Microbacterium sp.]
QRTIDAMAMGVVILDSDLKAELINRAFYDIWKITSRQVGVGDPFRALMDVNRHNGIYDVTDERWESYVASRLAEIRAGDVAPCEFRRADGCVMIYSVTALSGGKRLVSYYDVTEMKQREAEIAAANRRTEETFQNLRLMVDQMPIGIVVVDADMRTEVINHAFYDFWKVDPARFGVGVGFRELMEASRGIDSFDTDEAGWQAHMARREAEIRAGVAEPRQMPHKDGRTLVASLARLAGGKRLLCYVDVTELKNREKDAEEAHQRLTSVLESLPAAVLIYDRDDNFIFANRQLQDSMPVLKPAWQPGKTFRESLTLGHQHGCFRSSGDPEVDKLYDVDRIGLDRLDRAVLDAIVRRFRGGPVGLSTLAVSVGEEADTIESVVEPYLVRIGFLGRTPRGRIAMPEAYAHLGAAHPEGAALFDDL